MDPAVAAAAAAVAAAASVDAASDADASIGSPDAEATSQRPSKQAACLTCRKSKVKCEADPGQEQCRRCRLVDSECVRPIFHVGRQKGIKNKRKGLDKALHQIEQALKRARTGEHTADEDKVRLELHALLGHAVAADHHHQQNLSPPSPTSPRKARIPKAGRSSRLRRLSGGATTAPLAPTLVPADRPVPANGAAEESLAVDDAENPLQLLARASDLHPLAVDSSSSSRKVQNEEISDIQSFFTSIRVNLDNAEEIDPVCIGLVTEDEADMLFSFFHDKLAHTRWGLDPLVYTVAFTRARSAFLFSSIMAASALFMPAAAALSKRLSNHCKALANRVMTSRNRSVETVLAFIINVPWMFPSKHSTDDETSWYVSMALTVALDLSLHKVIMPLGAFRDGSPGNLARGDCIDPKVALALDGFSDVDSASEWGQRLLRRRERAWISLFVLERGMCLARGRSYTVPITPLLRDCDRWHLSPIAHPMDGHVVSMAVLRRDLDGLFSKVRALCDNSAAFSSPSSSRTNPAAISNDGGARIAQSIQAVIEAFFEAWHAEWGRSIGSGPLSHLRLPPYVEILVTHTRLSTYSGVINHPTAPPQVRHFFRTAGLSSALNVMRAAIQGEAQLASMPNNTAIMISFAAGFALSLSAQMSGQSSLAPSVRTLIEETADVLERVGNVTGHRNGMSAIYGRYLRHIVRRGGAPPAPKFDTAVPRDVVTQQQHQQQHQHQNQNQNQSESRNQNQNQPQHQHHNQHHQHHQHHQHQRPLQQPQPMPRGIRHGQQVGGAGHVNVSEPPMVSGATGTPTGGFISEGPGGGGASGGGAALWSQPIQFSSMADYEIVEALNQAGGSFEAGFPPAAALPVEDAAALDWLNLPDFAF